MLHHKKTDLLRLGSAVANVLAEEGIACNFKKLGIPDTFGVIGSPEDLYHKYGYDGEGIFLTLKQMLNAR